MMNFIERINHKKKITIFFFLLFYISPPFVNEPRKGGQARRLFTGCMMISIMAHPSDNIGDRKFREKVVTFKG